MGAFCFATESIRPSQLEVVKIELVQIFQCLLFLFGQRLIEQLACDISSGSPMLAQVFGNSACFLQAGVTKRAAQEHDGATELFVIE